MVAGTQTHSNRTKTSDVSLPLMQDSIEKTLQAERERLMAEAGLTVGAVEHFKRPVERDFTREERENVTVWIGGLTLRHDTLIKAGLEGLGYNVGIVPTPAKPDFQAGKEYGNNGQCNPTYFTVGALVNHLKRMRDDDGLPLDDIINNHIFVTAGACGPCRFGMYEAEYRLALRNSGFDGFRVMLFQQQGGLDQATVEAGLEMNLNFFLSLLNGVFMGDLLNEVAYHIRPYEVVPGKTNEVFAKCVALGEEALRARDYDSVNGGVLSKLVASFAAVKDGKDAAKLIDQLRGTYYADVFEQCQKLIADEVEVDYTRPKPVVKVTGEFWAQTTEGDGNFNMFPFLEAQGAEVLVEPVATWLCYMLHQSGLKAGDRRGIDDESNEDVPAWQVGKRLKSEWAYRKKRTNLALAEKILTREYERLRHALGGTAHELAPQHELTRMGHPYYNSRSGGGEGHLEVAKNIYYCNKDLAHMVLSLKPFGCMPSTQSDGAQAAVTSHFKDMIYIPIETSGEGDINAHSRVQMALGEAKLKCKDEFKNAVAQAGYSIEQIRDFVAEHRDLRNPLLHVPHTKGVIGRAANYVLFVGEKMKAAGVL